MDQRESFIRDWLTRRERMVELCSRYGISRKTGSKWVQRFYQGGESALVDHSRRPHRIAHAVETEVADTIVELRKRHPLWGPKKLRAWLEQHGETGSIWPALSTIGALLKERGLILERRRRIRVPQSSEPLAAATEPNVVWCTDFKGCFKVAGRYCHPLTLSDAFSRFLLRVESVDAERFAMVQPIFESAFREYGLPWRMRSDNGPPFASRAVGGLSPLSVWFIKLGITPERILPGHPEQNGRHERMHRTLKDDVASPPRSSPELQQRAFNEFRAEFNNVRPHEALGQVTPASVYRPSLRRFPDQLEEPRYPTEFEVRRVDSRGYFAFKHSNWKAWVGCVLANEAVGIEEIPEGRWQVWFGPVFLGTLTEGGKGQLAFQRNQPNV